MYLAEGEAWEREEGASGFEASEGVDGAVEVGDETEGRRTG